MISREWWCDLQLKGLSVTGCAVTGLTATGCAVTGLTMATNVSGRRLSEDRVREIMPAEASRARTVEVDERVDDLGRYCDVVRNLEGSSKGITLRPSSWIFKILEDLEDLKTPLSQATA